MENNFIRSAGLGRRVVGYTFAQRLAVTGLRWLCLILVGIFAAHWLANQILDWCGL